MSKEELIVIMSIPPPTHLRVVERRVAVQQERTTERIPGHVCEMEVSIWKTTETKS